jgi:hypothetical protein
MKVSYNPNKVFMNRPQISTGGERRRPDSKTSDEKFLGKIKSLLFEKKPKTPRAFKSKTEPHKAVYKVFKPKNDATFKNRVFQGMRPEPGRKVFSWGVKSLDNLRQGGLRFDSIVKNVNLILMRFQILEKFNRIMAVVSLLAVICFFVYLCFFDTLFLVKNYTVSFADGSYISSRDMQAVLNRIKSDKFAGFIPNNQFWFLNGPNLTVAAQRAYPEIQAVEVERRYWPNGAQIKVSTQPILLTLSINQNEYWRISQTGKVLSQDEAGLRENLVVVERRVEYNRRGVTLQDYSFENNQEQLNRFWFIIWLWGQLAEFQINSVKTSLPSLFDTDVQILTENGTRLIFDSKEMTRDIQSSRLKAVYDGAIRDKENQGKIAYIDFRVARRVFVCERGQTCDR